MTRLQTGPGTSAGLTMYESLSAEPRDTGEGLSGRQMAVWLRECRKHVEKLQYLNGNWDSYGAMPVRADSIESALQLISFLADIEEVDRPRIAASPAGHVALSWDWNNQSRELDVEVLPNRRYRYSYIDENDPSKDAEGQVSHPLHIVRMLTTR